MSEVELKAIAEALVTRTVENGDPFDGHDWEAVLVTRWSLELHAERDELRAACEALMSGGSAAKWDAARQQARTLLAPKGEPPC